MHKTSDLIKDNETVSQEIRRVAHEPSVDVDVDASTRRNLLPKLGRPSIAVESLERTFFFVQIGKESETVTKTLMGSRNGS